MRQTPLRGPGSFSVWAPDASTMDIVVDGDQKALQRDDQADGWWHLEPALDYDSPLNYGYLVDGQGPYPDPRSLRQPSGVHGLSQTFDTGAYAWSDHSWTGRSVAGAIIYELHIGTFTPEGNLDAAIGRLEHLRSIGVDFVELLPVNAFNGVHNWGYDGVLWYAVHEPYGGPEGYQRFVDACHASGIGVIQDVVYNHLGPSGNYLPKFGPYLRGDEANTWGSALNLDGPDSDEVRHYIIDNVMLWLHDFHVDGLRLDAVHALVDQRAMSTLEELSTEVERASTSQGRPFTLIAESDRNDPKTIMSREAGGIGIDAQWSDDFHHALHVALTGETSGYYADFAGLQALKKTLTQGFFHDGSYSTFRRRHHGRPIHTLTTPTSRLIVFSQDHDQVGNRAAGDRLARTLSDGQLAIAATLTLLGPYTPMLFMGQEWAASTPWQFFTSHPEPDLGKATADGRIAEFARMAWDSSVVPDPQDPETFRRSILDWSERAGGRHARILELYQKLAQLRSGRPDITDPDFSAVSVEVDEDDRWLVLIRANTTVAVNFSATPVLVPNLDTVAPLLVFGGYRDSEDGTFLDGHSVLVLDTERREQP
ncbi:MAG: malto-oligosyltrehalose trehalohydrolase [Terrimesophilobacter sp.]